MVIDPDDGVLDASVVGGKAACLARLQQAGLSVPPWVVLCPEAFDGIRARDGTSWSDGIPGRDELLRCLRADDEVRSAVEEHVGRLFRNGSDSSLAGLDPARLAVRSSAIDEDGTQHSFAGQFESFLSVNPGEVLERIVDVWMSGFGDRAAAYRQSLNLPERAGWNVPAVILQRMVSAETAGVVFSADPVSGRRSIAVVTAVRGLGDGLVQGAEDGETWNVDRAGVTRAIAGDLGEKDETGEVDPGRGPGSRSVAAPVLADDTAGRIAALAREIARRFGRPQDVEWAIAGGRIWVLQARPITALVGVPDPDGEVRLWDNSNITESYGGITLPLTFSFARSAYEAVYRQFCRLLKVPAARVAAHDATFRAMLGLIEGRVYYNLLNWYRVLALLPGFTVNRRFMEQMMGVKDGLPESVAAELRASGAGTGARLLDGIRFGVSAVALMAHFAFLNRRIRAFHRRLDRALDFEGFTPDNLRTEELVKHYRDLESRLLLRWDAPLLNDFFTMIFFGIHRRILASWCGDTNGVLANELLCGGDDDMISAEPARRLAEMAGAAAESPDLIDTLRTGSVRQIELALEGHDDLRRRMADYLETFGDRCLDELKLETPTLRDDPIRLMRSLGDLAGALAASGGRAAPRSADDPAKRRDAGGDMGRAARARLEAALRSRPVRRAAAEWILSQTRRRVVQRENLRFERTRVFARVRSVFVEIGRRFWAEDRLDDPRDVFYLTIEEVFGCVDATASGARPRDLVSARKREYGRYQSDSRPPPDRFETVGPVSFSSISGFRRAEPPVSTGAAGRSRERTGTGCCPGSVRGTVRRIADPATATVESGEILVAERTDPGWILLFPAAAGIVVARGSLLSHSAIVARELGIPTIVGIPDIMSWLDTGDVVEMDGGSGRVRRVAVAGEGR